MEEEEDSSSPILGSSKSLFFNLKTQLFQAMEHTVPTTVPKYEYRLAKLVHHNYNLKKRWYVDYYAWHIGKNKLVRVRQFEPLNRIKTIDKRLAMASELVSLINHQLRSGKCLGRAKELIVDAAMHDLRSLNIIQALQHFINQKQLDRLRRNSLNRFGILIKLWTYFHEHQGTEMPALRAFTPQLAEDFFRYLQTERSIGNKTFNNYRSDMITFWLWGMKKAKLKANPFEGISRLRVQTRKHASLSNAEIDKIKAECLKRNRTQLLLHIQFIYYTLMRPSELLQLRVHHINLNENRIFVPGNISKNRFDEFIPIAEPLRKIITDANLLNRPADQYIIGGEKTISGKTLFTHHKDVLQAVGLKGRNHTIYSYKHTGAIALYNATKDIMLLMRMMRHRTVHETQTYLRDLGLDVDYKTMLNGFKGAL